MLILGIYFTYGVAWGADLSAGYVATINKPNSGQLVNTDLRGFSENYTLGTGSLDWIWGGNSFYNSFDPTKGRDYYNLYETYGMGYSPQGLPLGFTRSTTETFVTDWNFGF